MLLLDGADGVPKDRAAAKALFEKAAAQGLASALYNLGVLALEATTRPRPIAPRRPTIFGARPRRATATRAYSYGVLLRQGQGVPLDIAKSAQWLKRSADAGIIAGQVEYAIMLFNGVGVAGRGRRGEDLHAAAAARNNPIAQNRLAHLYVSGRGVPNDLVQAAIWNGLAKAAGIDDPDLDAATASLTPEENKRVDELIRRQARSESVGRPPSPRFGERAGQIAGESRLFFGTEEGSDLVPAAVRCAAPAFATAPVSPRSSVTQAGLKPIRAARRARSPGRIRARVGEAVVLVGAGGAETGAEGEPQQRDVEAEKADDRPGPGEIERQAEQRAGDECRRQAAARRRRGKRAARKEPRGEDRGVVGVGLESMAALLARPPLGEPGRR